MSFTLCPLDLGDVAAAECWADWTSPEDEPVGNGPMQAGDGGDVDMDEQRTGDDGGQRGATAAAAAGGGDGVSGRDEGGDVMCAAEPCDKPRGGPGRDQRNDVGGWSKEAGWAEGMLLPLPALAWEDVSLTCPEETRICHVKKVRLGYHPEPRASSSRLPACPNSPSPPPLLLARARGFAALT